MFRSGRSVGRSERLIAAFDPVSDHYDVTTDGQRFLVITPEGQLTARFSVNDAADECLRFLERGRKEGFTSSTTLERDEAFEELRARGPLKREIASARAEEQCARLALADASSRRRDPNSRSLSSSNP